MSVTKGRKIILFIFALFLMGYFIFYFIHGSKDDRNKETETSSLEVKHSKYPGLDLITEVKDTEMYHIAMHYPQFKNKELNKEIEDYVSLVEQDFLTAVHDNKQSIKKDAANLSLTMDIYQTEKNIVSIVFSEESYVAGADPQHKTKIYLLDAEKGEVIQPTNIIQDTQQNREELHNLISEGFKESKVDDSFLFEEDLKEWVMSDKNDFSNLYFTDKSVVINFNQNETAAEAAVMSEVTIPIEKMQFLLTEEWREKLFIEHKEDGDRDNSDGRQIENHEEKNEDSSSDCKQVALTFDDGPHPEHTLKILEHLDKYDAKATFFMLGNRVDFYPEIAKKIANEGHELGNHTWNHKDLSTVSKGEGVRQIRKTDEIIKSVTGRESTVFRPPYGVVNEQVQQSIDTPTVLWTIDTLDWKSRNPGKILNTVKENVEDGSIILMHDIHETSVQAVELILKFLKAEGYECVPVSELKDPA